MDSLVSLSSYTVQRSLNPAIEARLAKVNERSCRQVPARGQPAGMDNLAAAVRSVRYWLECRASLVVERAFLAISAVGLPPENPQP
ncbi:MAG TPA: hypothetical protein VK395_07580 [Gemmataceae bacterium]|nr:hypothetical protein [Gemmataceae bacterium]